VNQRLNVPTTISEQDHEIVYWCLLASCFPISVLIRFSCDSLIFQAQYCRKTEKFSGRSVRLQEASHVMRHAFGRPHIPPINIDNARVRARLRLFLHLAIGHGCMKDTHTSLKGSIEALAEIMVGCLIL
jgi:hypothetical protein